MHRWEVKSQQPAFFRPLINLLAISSLYHNLINQHGPQAIRIFSFTSLPSHCSHFARKTSTIRDGRTEFRKRYQITQISRVATIWSNTFHRTRKHISTLLNLSLNLFKNMLLVLGRRWVYSLRKQSNRPLSSIQISEPRNPSTPNRAQSERTVPSSHISIDPSLQRTC